MSGPIPALAHAFLDWIKAPWKLLTVIFIMCTSALVAPRSWMNGAGVSPSIEHYRPLLILFAMGSGLLLLVTVVEEQVVKPIAKRRESERIADEKTSKLESSLRTVRPDEVAILSHFTGARSTVILAQDDGVAQNLVKKGILYCPETNFEPYRWSYCLTDDVTAYLERQNLPHLIAAIEKLKKKAAVENR